MPATLRLPDPDASFKAVRLVSDLPLDDEAREFRRISDDCWEFVLPPDLNLKRLEYLVEIESEEADDPETIADPVNGTTAPGAFGEKSVWQADDYEPPWWCDGEPVPARLDELPLRSALLDADVDIRVWSPTDVKPSRPLPLLVAHDGPEYDALAKLLHFVAVELADWAVPRCRVALLGPGERDAWYSANDTYADALAGEILPAIAAAYPTVENRTVGIGASLGGLAMFHAHVRHQGMFAALFLQSASFFVPKFDEHEAGFAHYRSITRFTRTLVDDGHVPSPGVPIVMTCGAEEENVHNNRLIAKTLGAELHELPDLHNFTAWRDAFEPFLRDLLEHVWT